MEAIMSAIGRNIKRLRLEHNMSQADLANRIGKTHSAVSMYESGEIEPRMGVVEKLAEVFGVPKSEIIESRYEYAAVSLYNDDERELLELYRSASDGMRNAVLGNLRAFKENSKR